MRRSYAAFLAFFVLIGALASTGCDAEEHKAAGKGDVSEQVEMLDSSKMEKLWDGRTVSEHHRIFADLVGTWDFDLKYWSSGDAKPQKSSGTMDNELVLGGKFLFGKMKANLQVGGQLLAYEGMHILGYDAVKQEYASALADTMQTGILSGTGQYDEERKVLEETGRFTHPLTDQEQAYRAELALTGADGFKRSVFINDTSGKEFKVLEMEFRRQR